MPAETFSTHVADFPDTRGCLGIRGVSLVLGVGDIAITKMQKTYLNYYKLADSADSDTGNRVENIALRNKYC